MNTEKTTQVTIVNMTPHAVVMYKDGEVAATFESNGVARARQSDEKVGTLLGFDTVRSVFGATEGLPEYVENTFVIVSAITGNAAKASGRRTDDLLLTSGLVRDEDGKILGCTAFALV
jgi:hypothetical protein